MLAMTIDVPGWIGFIVIFFGLCSTLGAALAIARSSAAKSSVEILTTINTELRADNAELRTNLQAEQTARLSDKHNCEREIAEMRGQLNAVTSTLGESIGREVGAAVGKEVITLFRTELERQTP